MSIPENTLVWAKYEDVWLPALTVSHEYVGAEYSEDCLSVLILDDEEWGCQLPHADVILFDGDEARLAEPRAQAGIKRAAQLIGTVPTETETAAVDDADELKRKEEKAARKLEKKEKKEERRLEKERKREERKRNRTPSPAESDHSSKKADETEEIEERDGLDEYIQSNAAGGRAGGVVISRLHDRSRATKATEYGSAELFVASAPASHANQLHRAIQWYKKSLSACQINGLVLAEHEVGLLRLVEEKLRTNVANLALLKSLKRATMSLNIRNKMLNEIEQINAFSVEDFCEIACPKCAPPPQKPEKRKGGRFHIKDPSIQSLVDMEKPHFRAVDPEVVRQITLESRPQTMGKSGFTKPAIMKRWLAGRELPVMHNDFDVQPVAAHGAVARRYSEFAAANESKALNKASRSMELSRFLARGSTQADPRTTVGSYFNFHDFREYDQASLLHDSEFIDVAGSSVPPELQLEFDPDAVFGAEHDLQGALAAFEANPAYSAQRSSLALASEQSMWVPESATSRQSSAMHSSAASVEDTEAIRPTSQRASGQLPASNTSSWRVKVRDIIIRRASLYVCGKGKAKCLPQHLFSEVVSELLRRAIIQKSRMEKHSALLRSNEAVWELTQKDANGIASSVDHYIERRFLGAAKTDRASSMANSSRRAHSEGRDIVYE